MSQGEKTKRCTSEAIHKLPPSTINPFRLYAWISAWADVNKDLRILRMGLVCLIV